MVQIPLDTAGQYNTIHKPHWSNPQPIQHPIVSWPPHLRTNCSHFVSSRCKCHVIQCSDPDTASQYPLKLKSYLVWQHYLCCRPRFLKTNNIIMYFRDCKLIIKIIGSLKLDLNQWWINTVFITFIEILIKQGKYWVSLVIHYYLFLCCLNCTDAVAY